MTSPGVKFIVVATPLRAPSPRTEGEGWGAGASFSTTTSLRAFPRRETLNQPKLSVYR